MNDIDIKYFEEKLVAEQKKIEEELATIGRKNPSNPEDWEPTPENLNVSNADLNERADSMEEYEARSAVVEQLEGRLNNVKHALDRIKKGTYGVCEVSGEPIERERLEANPAARTNIANKDVSLD